MKTTLTKDIRVMSKTAPPSFRVRQKLGGLLL